MPLIPARIALTATALTLTVSIFPSHLSSLLVRSAGAPAAQQSTNDVSSQSSLSAPTGKLRVSQEVQLTGDDTWIDTGIDIHAGERVLITATGKLRFADQKSDNGPEGLARGFKDLLRILPYNEAGRGALIGRIGDKDIAQPFLIGAKHDFVAVVDGRLS